MDDTGRCVGNGKGSDVMIDFLVIDEFKLILFRYRIPHTGDSLVGVKSLNACLNIYRLTCSHLSVARKDLIDEDTLRSIDICKRRTQSHHRLDTALG